MKDRSDDPSSILTTHCRRFYQGNYDYEFADEPRRNQVNIRWGEGADIFFKWMRSQTLSLKFSKTKFPCLLIRLIMAINGRYKTS